MQNNDGNFVLSILLGAVFIISFNGLHQEQDSIDHSVLGAKDMMNMKRKTMRWIENSPTLDQ